MLVKFAPSCLGLSQHPALSKPFPTHILLKRSRKDVRGCGVTRPEILPLTCDDAVGMRVFVISDLHTDYPDNMTWVKHISTKRHKNDVLIVAGDVAEMCKNFIKTMLLLKERFNHVLYVPGNHDLWCRWEGGKYSDSLEKLDTLLEVCRRLGVETNPLSINGLGIIPLHSWYHESFDQEKDITEFKILPLELACKDYHACKWPGELSSRDTSLALYFDSLNEENSMAIKEIQSRCNQIITFSHFVPRQELCPEKRMLFYPNLPKIIGSNLLESRIRSIHGDKGSAYACHVFGHTHFCWDSVIDGIRYVQAPLGYPRERKRRMNGVENLPPFCIYSEGDYTSRISPCYWSDYYSANPRTPQNTELAPWVARFYSRI